MRYLFFIIQLFLCSSLYSQDVKRMSIPGTKCSMEVGNEFRLATRFKGFEHTQLKASIIVSILPTSLAENLEKVQSEEMRSKGFHFVSKENVQLVNGAAMMFELQSENNGVKQKKFFLIFGDSTKTVFIDAMAPDSISALCNEIKRVILTTKYDPFAVEDPFESKDFTMMVDTGVFKLMKNTNTAIIFTSGQTTSPAFLSFSISAQSYKAKLQDEKSFAEAKLKGLNGSDSVLSSSYKPIEINNLKGYLLQTCTNSKLNKLSYNYQVFLFGKERNYYLIMGRSMNSQETSERTFEPIVNTFKLKP